MSTVLRLSFKLDAKQAEVWARARVAAVEARRARGIYSEMGHSNVLWFLLQRFAAADSQTGQASQTRLESPRTKALAAFREGQTPAAPRRSDRDRSQTKRRPRQVTLDQAIRRAKKKSVTSEYVGANGALRAKKLEKTKGARR